MNNQNINSKLKIISICGSVRYQYSYHLMNYINTVILSKESSFLDIEIQSIHFKKYKLDIFDPSVDLSKYNSKTTQFIDLVKQANIILVVVPEYHGSLPGVLKNALDYLSFDITENKIISMVSISGGFTGGVTSLSHLSDIALQLKMIKFHKNLNVSYSYSAFNENRQPNDSKLIKRINDFIQQLLTFSLHLS